MTQHTCWGWLIYRDDRDLLAAHDEAVTGFFFLFLSPQVPIFSLSPLFCQIAATCETNGHSERLKTSKNKHNLYSSLYDRLHNECRFQHKADNAEIPMLGVSGIPLDIIKQTCHACSNRDEALLHLNLKFHDCCVQNYQYPKVIAFGEFCHFQTKTYQLCNLCRTKQVLRAGDQGIHPKFCKMLIFQKQQLMMYFISILQPFRCQPFIKNDFC